MSKAYTLFEDFLKRNKREIVGKILETIDKHEPEIFLRLSNQYQSDKYKEQIEQFILILGRQSGGEDLTDEIIKWAKNASEDKASHGLTLYQSIQHFKLIRKIVWESLNDFVNEREKVNVIDALDLGAFINDFIDEIILTFTTSYTGLANKRLLAQQEVIDELSAPVISIVDGVAVLPIIGDIDTHRAKILMEHTLRETNKLEVECLIIDLSGVFIVDTMVAQELFKIISSLELTGVEVNLTGMRPELAQSVVILGINFDQVKVFNNLGQALKAFGIVRK